MRVRHAFGNPDPHTDMSDHEPVLHEIPDSLSVTDSSAYALTDTQTGVHSDSVPERDVCARNRYAFSDTDVDANTDTISCAGISE